MIGLDDLCLATGGQLYGEATVREFSGISDDPAHVRPGELFVVSSIPESGQLRDIERALGAGASGLLCETPPIRDVPGVTTVLVGDARLGLEQWAAFVMRQYHPLSIAVVGQHGRAALCEAIVTVLGSRFPVHASIDGPAGPYQVALAVGRMEPQHVYAVFELNPDRFNSLADMIAVLQPQVLVFSGPLSQIGGLRSPLGTIADSIQQALGRLPARAVIAADMADRELISAAKPENARVVTFTVSAQSDVTQPFSDIACEQIRFDLDGFTLNVRSGGDVYRDVRLPGIGSPAVGRLLSTLAVCHAVDFSSREALIALANQTAPGDIRLATAANGALLVDASNRAGPETALALLGWVDQLGTQLRRRFLVLGDFAEGGGRWSPLAYDIGQHAIRSVDAFIALDDSSLDALAAARQGGFPVEASLLPRQRAMAGEFLQTNVGAGDAVIFVSHRRATVEPIIRSLSPDVGQGASGVSARLPLVDVQPLAGQRAWLEVDLPAIAENVRLVRRNLPAGVALIAVVKDDAFRHGTVETARIAVQNGADMLAVSTIDDGLALRAEGLDGPVLVLGHSPAEALPEAIAAGLILSIQSRTYAALLAQTGRRMKARPACHIRVSGSPREAGVPMAEVITLMREMKKADQLAIDGLFVEPSATPGPAWVSENSQLIQKFGQINRNLVAAGMNLPYVHAAGSAAMLSLQNSIFSAARIGHLLYGVMPFATSQRPAGLKPALTWKTTICDLVSERDGRSSGGERRMAVIPVGYRDGLNRTPRGQEMALVEGVRAPLGELVGPDWAYVDITNVSAAYVGSEVTLIGGQGREQITAEELAGLRGVASYDVISMIPSTLRRLYNR